MDLISLAKKSIETYIKERKIISVPKNLEKEFLNKKAGVFVTIEKNKELRGCIGTYLPYYKNIAEETIHNAVTAATEDYRFEPIQPDELSQLSYTIYILNTPEQIKGLKELDPKKYGIIIKTTDGKCGLLLPDLNGVNSIQEQISIACQKGEINPKKDKLLIYKFTTKKYD